MMFLRWSTEISPLENFRLAYAAKVDCNSYMMTPLNLDMPAVQKTRVLLLKVDDDGSLKISPDRGHSHLAR